MNILANFSNTINIGQNRYKHYVNFQVSKLNLEIAGLLFQENLIRGFFLSKESSVSVITVLLKYQSNQKIFNNIKLLSKANAYKQSKAIRRYQNGLGLYVLSTSKGVMTNYRASKLKLGGVMLIRIF
jgi:small subunit ribosomal protein S8